MFLSTKSAFDNWIIQLSGKIFLSHFECLVKATENIFSCVKKGIVLLHQNNHHTILYEKNYFVLDI